MTELKAMATIVFMKIFLALTAYIEFMQSI